jgi:hypothetical protein
MSTNYYWIHNIPDEIEIKASGATQDYFVDNDDPFIHIGLTSGHGFTWAQDPETVVHICMDNLNRNIVYNEYNLRDFTGEEFLEIINGIDWDTRLIGKWFS